ncbi:hypothetical protein ABH922_001265 [Rhodococcus sp. 27YEA15]|uniref:hypothetical protein n=1 Tax=Rhodococcus sp. 27YEA15 TaxID=3156259 RepID=UPI003C7EA87B
MSMQTGNELEEWGEHDTHTGPPPRRRGPHWPTVAVSACVAGVIGAAIPGLVLLGMHLGDQDRQVVVTMATPAGLPTKAADSGVTVLDPQVPASAAPSTTSTAANAPAASAPAAQAPAPVDAPAADAAVVDAPAAQGPSTPELSTLNSQLQRGLSSATTDAEVAASIEGGAAGVPTVRAVGGALNIASAIYKWELSAPVTVTGDVARAQLTTSLPGTTPTQATLKWYWIDGQWKLSNDSLCFMAHRAMAKCTVPGNAGGPNGHPL